MALKCSRIAYTYILVTAVEDPVAGWISYYVPEEITLILFGKILTVCRNVSNAN
jgi:hypothetical protein